MTSAERGLMGSDTGADTQAIDVAVILNALRALTPAWSLSRVILQPAAARALHQGHHDLKVTLDRLREIADGLDDAAADVAIALIEDAKRLVSKDVVEHERDDESRIYPRLAKLMHDGNVLAAMSRAHREILHLARLLGRLSDGLKAEDADRYLIRDAQRVIEAIESLVRIHSAQEEDLYEHAARA